MTDFETMIEMLDRAKLKYEINILLVSIKGKIITVEGLHKGFFTSMAFNENGSLHSIEAWE